MENKKKLLIIIFVSLVLIVIAGGFGIKATSKPSFCTNCHEVTPAVNSFLNSPHKIYGATCLDCHAGKGELNLIIRKISSVKEIYIHLTNTPKASELKGNVPSERCLECHSGKKDQKLPGADITKFTGDKGQLHKNTSVNCAGCHINSIHKAE